MTKTHFVVLMGLAVLLSGCQAAADYLASPAGNALVSGLVDSGIGKALGAVDIPAETEIKAIAESVAKTALEGVKTGEWKWDEELIPLAITGLVTGFGVDKVRTNRRKARGEAA